MTHVALHVHDFEACLRFYREYCGMVVVHQRPGSEDDSEVVWLSEPGRERELMASVADDETVRVMLGNVKLGVAGKALQRQKAELKKERKQLATQASKAKAKGDLA